MPPLVQRRRATSLPRSPVPARAFCRIGPFPPGGRAAPVARRRYGSHRHREENQMNCTQQIGRLTGEPDPLKSTEHGVVTTFRIAVSRPKASARDADFFTVEAWQRLAAVCVAHLRRGREVAVEGRLEQREWRPGVDEARE